MSCLGATHIPERWDETGKPYRCDVDDAAYATFQLDGGDHRPHQQLLVHARAARRSRDLPCRRHSWLRGRRPAECWSQARVNTPRPVWNPDVPQPINFFETWRRCRTRRPTTTASRREWEMFIRHLFDDAPFKWTLLEGAKGVQLAEARAAELEGAALDRRPGAEGVMFFTLLCSLFVLHVGRRIARSFPGLRCAHAPGCRVTRQTILACHSGRASRAWPGEGEPESSNQSGSCIHAGRGLLGPYSREPG